MYSIYIANVATIYLLAIVQFETISDENIFSR